jgi:DNA-binding MarR family transcriptional regulator
MTKRLSETAIQAWARLIRVEQALLDKVEADLKAADLPPLVWYDALLELSRAADNRLRHRDLHARMLLAKYNLSRLIDRMEAKGVIERVPCSDDGRGAHIAITSKGRDLHRRMWPVYGRAIDRHFAGRLIEADIADLNRVFAKLI